MPGAAGGAPAPDGGIPPLPECLGADPDGIPPLLIGVVYELGAATPLAAPTRPTRPTRTAALYDMFSKCDS